jgi:hypothetical protein
MIFITMGLALFTQIKPSTRELTPFVVKFERAISNNYIYDCVCNSREGKQRSPLELL